MSEPNSLLTDSPILQHLLPFWKWRKLWIGTTVSFAFVGLLYALVLKSDTWVATQGLIVRDEAAGAVMRLGRFESQTQMKAAQELVLEMASSPQVVAQVLEAAGKPPRLFGLLKGGSTHSPAEIEAFGRRQVSVRAPRGAELGTTEVIYLDLKDQSKERAVMLTTALCDALESQLQEMRRARADGVIQELKAALSVSESQLELATEKLKNIEMRAGADLVDLRGLTDANTGSTNRLMLDMVRDDLRKSEFEMQLHRENLEAIELGLKNPDLLIQITDRLAESQPTIRKLREGLSEARLRTAQLQGRFSESHADVIVAKVTEQRFRDNLLQELTYSHQAILGAIEFCQTKIAKLNDQERELGKRLNQLADIRADYTNVVSEVKATNDELQQIRRDLTQAMAAKNAASASSLITRIGEPQLSDRPIGPGRSTIVGGSLMGGLFLGLGVVFMLTPLGRVSELRTAPLDFDGLARPPVRPQAPPSRGTSGPIGSHPINGPCPTSELVRQNSTFAEPATFKSNSFDCTVANDKTLKDDSSSQLAAELYQWETKLRMEASNQRASSPSPVSSSPENATAKSASVGKRDSAEFASSSGVSPVGLEEIQSIIAKSLEGNGTAFSS